MAAILRWRPGQGLGFSPLAEAYLNFGWFGPLIQYCVFGFVWGKAWRLVQRVFSTIDPAYWHAVYTVGGFYLLTLMHRGTANILKPTLQLILPLLILSHLLSARRASASPKPRRLGVRPTP